MGDGSIVGQIFFSRLYFLKRNDRAGFDLIMKTPVLRNVYIMVVKVGKSADKHCLRRRGGMRSGSPNVLDD